ncbi:MAG: ribonuclease E/G, partial [Ornithinimicrobium sp.]
MSTTDEPTTTNAATAEAQEPAKGTAKKAAPSAGFGLVFQAPDLSDVPARKPRPRREPAPDSNDAPPAGHDGDSDTRAPQQRPRQATKTDESQSGDAEAGNSAHAAPDAEGEGESDGASKNRRRKRGGKGRRGRGQSGDGGQDGSGSDEDAGSGSGSNDQRDDDGSDGGDSGGRGASTASRSGGAKSTGGKSGNNKQGGAQSGEGRSSAGDGGTKDNADTSDAGSASTGADETDDDSVGSSKRRRRRRRGDSPERTARDEVTGVRGSTRLEAKRQRRREGREVGRRRTVISEAEFLARRESVDRVMVVRGLEDRTQIGVLEDGVLVEHYVSQQTQSTTVGNVYLGRVQNVLPSMEAAFVDIGKGRNAVLYAGEVNWDAAGLEVNQAKRIENALTSGESVLVQVTKDPIGHKGARLTSQVSLPGRFLVYVPGNSMTGISRKLPDTERARLKKILKEVVPPEAGVIVRTAAEGASEADLRADVERLTAMWEDIQAKAKSKSKSANGPVLLHGEPEMTVRVIRDVFNEDFNKLIVSGNQAWEEVSDYIERVAPDLRDRVEKWTSTQDIFTEHRITEA